MSKVTKQSEDFAKWYLDVNKYAELMDYSKVKGCMIIRPYGYAIWENIQSELNKRIKKAGVSNVYFPMFIPESFINKEKDHIEGFAPECAIVTQGGGKELEEPLYVRPTSETIIHDTFSNWIQSYRDLPLKINQWANVVRWEMRTRPWLRTLEFLWQEGHTAHATKEDADKEMYRALKMYEDFDKEVLSIPVLTGKKTKKETFAGALYTVSTEALARDGKAIQAGTSHNLGQGFSKSFDITFSDENEKTEYAWLTSWGVSTRIVGTIIVVHGDDLGLRLPPQIAPIQVVGIPIWKSDEEKVKILEEFSKIQNQLPEDIRFHVDDRDKSPGYKFNEYEVKGVPLRVEFGPRDLQSGSVVVARRDTNEKSTVKLEELIEYIPKMLKEISVNMYEEALDFQHKNTHDIETYDEMKKALEEKGGLIRAPWCGETACEESVQEETKATIRVIDGLKEITDEKCLKCSSDAKSWVYFAKAY